MGYRILVDENVDPHTTDLLRDRGHEAVHVEENLGKGVGDSTVAGHARENDYVVLTNDTDFLRTEGRQGCKVLYCPDNTKRASDIVALIADLTSAIPDQADLPAVTWVTEELSF